MIADVDEALRKCLVREIGFKANEVDIQFDQPKREWSARLSKPTLNLFLFDIRENLRLRGAEQFTTLNRPDGTSEVRRNPVRMDLRYLLTAWVKEPEDEHLLLSSAINGLLRNPFLPDYALSDQLKAQPNPIPVEVANFPPEIGPVDKFSEIWGVLDNEMRPGLLLTITLSLDPYQPMVFKQVKTRELRFMQDTALGQPAAKDGGKSLSKTYWVVGGTIKSEKYDLSTLSIVLVEKHLPVKIREDGRFALQKLTQGDYHLDILFNNKVLKRQQISVPGSAVEIKV